MDHLSFVFSFLLIVSVTTTTTFGSVIKANNPNGEALEEPRSDPDLSLYPEMARNLKELEALLKRSHKSNPDMENDVEAKLQGQMGLKDQTSEEFKRGVTREVFISLENHSGCKWQSPSVFKLEGTKIAPLDTPVRDGKTVECRPSTSETKASVGGIISYYIEDKDKTLSVMFFVPFDQDLGENRWNVRLDSGKTEPSVNLYAEMFATAFHEGFKSADLGVSLKFDGDMTGTGKAVLDISILTE